MRQYVGLIHKEEKSDYSVPFPDFPGCVSAAASLDEARAMAEEALAFHVEGCKTARQSPNHPLSSLS